MAQVDVEIPMLNMNNARQQDESNNDRRQNWLQQNPIVATVIVMFGLAMYILFIAGIIYLVVYSNDEPLESSNTSISSIANDRGACHSKPCEQVAEMVRSRLNDDVRPCDNFHNFACRKEFKDPKLVTAYNDLIHKLITKVSEINSDSPEYLKKLKSYYVSCVEDSAEFSDIKKRLDAIMNPYSIDLNWTDVNHRLLKNGIPAHYLMHVSLVADFNNSSRKAIFLEQPTFSDGFKFNIHHDNLESLLMYKKSMSRIFRFLRKRVYDEAEFHALWNVQERLMNISRSVTNPTTFEPWTFYEAISIKDLEKKYPAVKWLDFINGIFAPYEKIDANETVYISTEYIDKFHEYLMSNGTKPSNQVLVSYLLLRAAHYLDQELSPWDQKSWQYLHKRRIPCMKKMNKHLYLATSALYLRNRNNTDDALIAVQRIAHDVRKAFRRLIQNVTWMNDEMKKKIDNKIGRMDFIIGYPKELLNDTLLNDYYEDLEPSEGLFMYDLINLERFKFIKNAQSYKKPYNKRDWTKDFGRFIGRNPYYSFDNSVYIPGALIESIFYDENVPNYVNYAMIGEILGHEAAHALGTDMIHFDENGNYHEDWWDPISSESFIRKTDCIVEKYNRYQTILRTVRLQVNGLFTLNENLADINGLKAAYDAYIESMKDKPKEKHLPGLGNYTNNQLFWITYASTWCPNGFDENESSILKHLSSDPHTPMIFRTNGAVSSISEFAKDFNCTPHDPMNSPKCYLWF